MNAATVHHPPPPTTDPPPIHHPPSRHASATPSQYRMVALDLDGTLLNKEHQLTEASAEMLRSLSSSGFTVVRVWWSGDVWSVVGGK